MRIEPTLLNWTIWSISSMKGNRVMGSPCLQNQLALPWNCWIRNAATPHTVGSCWPAGIHWYVAKENKTVLPCYVIAQQPPVLRTRAVSAAVKGGVDMEVRFTFVCSALLWIPGLTGMMMALILETKDMMVKGANNLVPVSILEVWMEKIRRGYEAMGLGHVPQKVDWFST